MPGSVTNATIATPPPVLPQTLSAAFAEVRALPVVANEYPGDGTSQRAKQADTPRRRWRLAKRLTAAQAVTLREFWEARRGIEAFYFYNPFEPASGRAIGSNYDEDGVSTQGRYTVVFAGAWQQSTGMVFTDVPIEFIEVG